MERTVELGMLFAYYGAFLTERQQSILSQRIDQDYSLGEIAEREGISRQGVFDLIRRAQAQLYEMEARLKLVERTRALEAGLTRLSALVQQAKLSDNEKRALLQEVAALQSIWEDDDGV